MTFARLGFGFVVLSVVALQPAAAWEINPTENRYKQGQTPGVVPFDPLHETITWNALDCALDDTLARDLDGLKACLPLSFADRPEEPGNDDSALIRGVWWNDDPEQMLNSVNYPRFAVNMARAERDSRTPGKINGGSRMQYRSHYGDLQFLHAMAAADGEPAAETRRKVLDWMEFAYGVASGAIDPSAPLGTIELAMPREFFAGQAEWTVARLFNPRESLGEGTLPEHALGSMLHVIEDSFAAGHTGRNTAASAICPFGTVWQFRAYQSEDSDKHSVADGRAALETADPRLVSVAARLIELQRAGAPWESEVKPFLEAVFCLDDLSLPAGPGEFARDATDAAPDAEPTI
jgi:hypothetical protein